MPWADGQRRGTRRVRCCAATACRTLGFTCEGRAFSRKPWRGLRQVQPLVHRPHGHLVMPNPRKYLTEGQKRRWSVTPLSVGQNVRKAVGSSCEEPPTPAWMRHGVVGHATPSSVGQQVRWHGTSARHATGERLPPELDDSAKISDACCPLGSRTMTARGRTKQAAVPPGITHLLRCGGLPWVRCRVGLRC